MNVDQSKVAGKPWTKPLALCLPVVYSMLLSLLCVLVD